MGTGSAKPWWQTRAFVIVALVLAAIPLVIPAFPPLVDLPGHMGRYRILAEAGHGPLAAHFGVRWALIGNLGVDLFVLGLHPLLDIEPATKLVVLAIPVLTIGAMLWAAREAQGRIPATAGFALPLAFGYPFQLGFVNYCLSAGLAIAGLALWIRMARGGHPLRRALVFLPIACAVWVVHSFGWAMLGLFVFGAEWQIRIASGEHSLKAAARAALMCAPMAVPVIAMLARGADSLHGDTDDFFNMLAKLQWLMSIFRERWQTWDVGAFVVILGVLWYAIRSRETAFNRVLGVPALFGLVAFVVLPRLYQGGAYIDMRLLPYALALALLSIRLRRDGLRAERWIAVAASIFFAARIAGTTIAFLAFAQGQQEALRALRHLPEAGAALVLVNEPVGLWATPRLEHVAGLAIVHRRMFVNEQWALPGQQLIHPLDARAAPFDRDPSQLVYPPGSLPAKTDFADAVAHFDRCTFSHVWTIGFGPRRARAADLAPVWSDATSTVYRVTAGPQDACLTPPLGARHSADGASPL